MLIEFIKTVGGPGSLGFLAFGAGIGLAIRRWVSSAPVRRLATVWLWILVASYLVLALPLTANALAGRLPRVATASESQVNLVDTLFIFDGDNRDGRARAAARVARSAKLRNAWLLGPDYMIDDLARAGFPPGLITHDSSSATTLEQVRQVKMMSASPRQVSAIIASRVSIPRIAAFARLVELDALLVAAPLDREPAARGILTLIPSYSALSASRDAIYELVALRYYGLAR